MTLTFSDVGLCAGGTHVTMTVTVDGTRSRRFGCLLSDLTAERPDLGDTELNDLLPLLLRWVIKPAGATTLAQARTALLNATVKV